MSLFGRSELDTKSWWLSLRKSAPVILTCLLGIFLAWLILRVVFFNIDKAGVLAIYNADVTIDSIVWGIASLGDVIWVPLIFWLYVFRKDKHDWTSAVIVAVAMVASMAAVLLLKTGFNLPRPFNVLPQQISAKGEFPPPTNPGFPSGHTTNAFTVASIMWARYRAWRVPFLTLGVATGVSMVILGLHFPSDVIAGASLGALSGAFALNLAKLRGDA